MADVPTTPAGGNPVAFVNTKALGVPNAGVVKTGEEHLEFLMLVLLKLVKLRSC